MNENAHITLPLEQLQQRFKQVVLVLPQVAGNEVVNFALDNFKRQGFLGNSLERWKPRKNPNKWGKTPARNSRAILMDTGRLRRSIRIVRLNMDEVVVGTDVPYAAAHNNGLRIGQIQNVKEHSRKITTLGVVKTVSRKTKTNITFGRKAIGGNTVKAHTRRVNVHLPKRQFLGNSPYLTAQLKRAIGSKILKATKP